MILNCEELIVFEEIHHKSKTRELKGQFKPYQRNLLLYVCFKCFGEVYVVLNMWSVLTF